MQTWIESHVVYVGAYPTIPTCLGQVDEVMITLVDLFEFELEVGKFVIGKIASVLQSMLLVGCFFNCWDEDGFACFVPAFTFGVNGDCCFVTSTRDSFTKSVVAHIVRGEFE